MFLLVQDWEYEIRTSYYIYLDKMVLTKWESYSSFSDLS